MDSKQWRGGVPGVWGAKKRAGIGPAEVMLLLVAAVWGGSYAVAKQATQQLPVLEFIALRFGLTFVVLLPALGPLFNAQWRQGLAVGGVLGANLLAIFLCETFGVSLTTASNAAFLVSLCVALTPFVEWWLLGQRPAQRMFWAAGMSAVGAAMLSATSPADISVGWGDGLMVAAAFLRAVMVCMTRRLAGKHAMPALTLTAVQSGVMALGAMAISLVATPPNGAWHMPPATASFWWGMAYLVLLCTVFAFFAQNHAASRTSPSRVSLLMGSEPMFGALIAVCGFGEKVGAWGWIGGVSIVVAAWWVTMPQAAVPRGSVASFGHCASPRFFPLARPRSTMSFLVFVFGTLKQGFPNFATNKGTRVAGSFMTVERYPLYLVGERFSPWLVHAAGEGERVVGQVFKVDRATLDAMDVLERIAEPDGYRRLPVDVEALEGEPEAKLTVQAYFKPRELFHRSDARWGPLPEYTEAHAALYRSRAPDTAAGRQG